MVSLSSLFAFGAILLELLASLLPTKNQQQLLHLCADQSPITQAAKRCSNSCRINKNGQAGGGSKCARAAICFVCFLHQQYHHHFATASIYRHHHHHHHCTIAIFVIHHTSKYMCVCVCSNSAANSNSKTKRTLFPAAMNRKTRLRLRRKRPIVYRRPYCSSHYNFINLTHYIS